MDSKNDNIEKLKKIAKKLSNYRGIESILFWDLETQMPSGSVEYRGDLLEQISSLTYEEITSSETAKLLEYFKDVDDLDDVQKAMVRVIKKSYDNINKIPKDKFSEFSKLKAQSSNVWIEAKNKNDFELFRPYLEKLVNFQIEFADYIGYKTNRYDALLEEYEPGFNVEKLDEVFSVLRDEIVKLNEKIKGKNLKFKRDFLEQKVPISFQSEFGKFMATTIGYDFNKGRLDEVEHPFCTTFNMNDVRITTHFYENNFTSSMFSNLHEGGHGIYEQNIDKDLYGTYLDTGVSNGIHESQSRFYENFIGRSKGFSKFILKNLKEKLNDIFANVSEQDFYRAINIVNPSLIRIEADELTYSLHIIIRYEIEKELINGKIKVADLPTIWNEKYKKYLGVEPPTNSLGVLQDVHWSEGSFGYFPSYALGNLYGAQFLSAMKKDISDFEKNVEEGNIVNITNWLNTHIHKYGSIYEPYDLIVKVTGEELNSKYFVDYLNKKYGEIYEL